MLDFPHLLALVPVLPLLGAVFSAVFGSIKELKPRAHIPAVFCAALSCVCALAVVAKLLDNGTVLRVDAIKGATGNKKDTVRVTGMVRHSLRPVRDSR